MASLKVFGGVVHRHGGQYRAVVAVSSQRKAAQALGVSLKYLQKWCSITHNEKELEIALANPGQVFMRKFNGDFKPAVLFWGCEVRTKDVDSDRVTI